MQQFSLFDTLPKGISKIDLSELFEAYFNCRSNKRNTANAIAFVVDKPVIREIFAADFRDRIVHHLIFNKLNPLFEKTFIHDSYACRIGKGTHLGIQRIDKFIRQCSENYTQDCYILKLDIKGFFMHINKNILFEKLSTFINQHYLQTDKELLLALCHKIIFNDPTKNCIIKGKRSNWDDLPTDKSLFHSAHECGLPIGNLTSQVFANFYMNSFDHFVKHDLSIRYYGRYVDDFIIIHQDLSYLKSLIPVLSNFLLSTLQLPLHPKKIYLQHYTKGVQFLGTVIKPNRIYIANRTKGNFYTATEKQNIVARDHKPTKEEQSTFLSSMNSYLGIMKHYKTYKLRKGMLFKNLSGWWWNYVYLSGGIAKFNLKKIPTLR